MNNYVVSLIRTYVPVGVGAVLGWLATQGMDVSAADRVSVTAVATAVITAAYYAGVRGLEAKWPAAGVLLGHPAKPSYARPGDSGDSGGAGGHGAGPGRPGGVVAGR